MVRLQNYWATALCLCKPGLAEMGLPHQDDESSQAAYLENGYVNRSSGLYPDTTNTHRLIPNGIEVADLGPAAGKKVWGRSRW